MKQYFIIFNKLLLRNLFFVLFTYDFHRNPCLNYLEKLIIVLTTWHSTGNQKLYLMSEGIKLRYGHLRHRKWNGNYSHIFHTENVISWIKVEARKRNHPITNVCGDICLICFVLLSVPKIESIKNQYKNRQYWPIYLPIELDIY